jgi:hypothetical protein
MRVIEKAEPITNRTTCKATALPGLQKGRRRTGKILYVEKFKVAGN